MSGQAKKIETTKAPRAIGPYSQGVCISSPKEWIFVSGQLPVDPETGNIVDKGIRLQTGQTIDNLEAVLLQAGSSLRHVLRVDIFLKSLEQDFEIVNEEYAKRFVGFPAPARQTVQVQELPCGSSIEMSCIAFAEDDKK